MKFTLISLTVCLLIFIGGFLAWRHEHRQTIAAQLQLATLKTIRDGNSPDATGAYMIHEPAEGCPEGWTRIPDIFHQEERGTTSAGCYRFISGTGEAYVDYIDAKESVTMRAGVQQQ